MKKNSDYLPEKNFITKNIKTTIFVITINVVDYE